jgi:sugar lactone lactonase YvrE
MNRVLLAAAIVVILPVAACGGTNDARLQSPALGVDGGDDGAGATGARCGTNQPANGPIRLASGTSPSSIAIDGTTVYWIDSALGTVNEVPSCGGAATTLVTTSTLGSSTLIPAGIAVQGGAVYFTTQDPWNPNDGDGAVWRVPSSGGTPTMLVQGLDRPGPIAVTGASMYWIESWETHADDGRVVQAPIDGSSTNILASAQNGPVGLALGDGYVVWTTSGFVDSVRGTIWDAPAGGGVGDGIGVGQDMPVSVAVDGTNAFWADEGDPNVPNSGSIMKKPLDPNAAANPVTLVSGGAPQGIAVDGRYAYWTDSQAQTVNRVPLAGGAPTTVATRQVAPLAIAVDETSVYWTTVAVGTGVGSVMKIAK